MNYNDREKVPPVWQVGDVILDRYKVKQIFTSGGMGLVYRVHHHDWETDLAVKAPRAESFLSQRQRERFVHECLTWIGLGLHTHIVCCYYVRVLGGIPRVFAEYVEGGSLMEWIESRRLYESGPEKALERILDVAIQFAWGLGYAHEQGLIHQDVKPANVMLTREGVVKVNDFGLAKARATTAEATVGVPGMSILVTSGGMTKAYCSPEQANIAAMRSAGHAENELPKLTRQTDIWSWAISVLEMFMGELPCPYGGQAAGEVFEEYLRFEQKDPTLPEMPEGLVDLMRRCFHSDVSERPGDFGQIAERLREAFRQVTGTEHLREFPKEAKALPDALSNEGISLLDLGMKVEAEIKFSEALKADPEHPEATYNQGLLQWRAGTITDQQLVMRLEEVTRSHPARNRARYVLALAHIERGDAESAVTILEDLPGLKERQALDLARSGVGRWYQFLKIFEGDIGMTVTSVAVSPDGRRGLSGSEDKTLRLWELATGKCLRMFEGHTMSVTSVAISQDGRWALSGSDDKTLRLWELATGKCLRIFEGHTSNVTSVAISPNSRWALSGSDDTTLGLWELATGKRLGTFEGHTGKVTSVAITPDGRWALSGSVDCTVRLWELTTANCVRTLEELPFFVECVAISPDSRLVLSGSYDSTLRLWNVPTGECLRIFGGQHKGGVSSVAISPDGCWALSGSGDGSLRLWQLRTGRCLRTFQGPHTHFVQSVALSPDGGWALWGNHWEIILWGLMPGIAQDFVETEVSARESLGRNREVKDVIAAAATAMQSRDVAAALSAMRTAFAIPGYERNRDLLDYWAGAGRNCRTIGLRNAFCREIFEGQTESVTSVVISPDGRLALTIGWWDESFRLRELATGKCLRAFDGHTDSVTSVAISPDGLWALSGSEDKTLRLWELATGKCLRTCEAHTMSVTSVAIGPDGRWALSGSEDTTLRLWELGAGKCMRTFEGHTDSVTSVAISPDGLWALSGGSDDTLRLWELATGECLRTFEGHTSEVTSIAISPDGRWALSGSSVHHDCGWLLGTGERTRSKSDPDDNSLRLRLWELATGECLRTFKGHTEPVTCVAISLDGCRALSGSEDKTIRLWELATGKCLRKLEGHTSEVNSVAISPDDRWALSGSDDETLRLWELDWDYEFPGWADWDERARPWLSNFLTLHTPVAGQLPAKGTAAEEQIQLALSRRGKPQWTEDNFKGLLQTLSHAGYGWLRADGVRHQLQRMAAEWQCPPLLPWKKL